MRNIEILVVVTIVERQMITLKIVWLVLDPFFVVTKINGKNKAKFP